MLVILIILLAIPATILRGWILTYLWTWFIVPIFGLPILSLVEAIAVSFVVGFLTRGYNEFTTDKDDWERVIAICGLWFIAPFLILGTGWIIKSFF